MSCLTNEDVIHYISASRENIDSDSPIAPNQTVLLRKGQNEFMVLVETIEVNALKGTVTNIGPIPSLEAEGITRGKLVSFTKENVFRVYRDMESDQ